MASHQTDPNVLAENITITHENPCLLINSSDVVLDGDGHFFNSQFQDSPAAIANFNTAEWRARSDEGGPSQALSNITVKNVGVRDVTRGVVFLSVSDPTVSNSTMLNSGIDVRRSTRVKIVENTMRDGGISVDDSDHVIVRNNKLSGGWRLLYNDGMEIEQSRNIVVSQNTVTGTHNGIRGRVSENITVRDNLLRENEVGISVNAIGETRIESNTITENINGIEVAGGAKFLDIQRNTITENGEFGISAPGRADAVVNATNNYWGAANGPSSPTDLLASYETDPDAPFKDPVTGTLADGDGDEVTELEGETCPPSRGISMVHFDPWLNQPVTNASDDGAG